MIHWKGGRRTSSFTVYGRPEHNPHKPIQMRSMNIISSSSSFTHSPPVLARTWPRTNYCCYGSGANPIIALAAAATMTFISISCVRVALSWNVPSIPSGTASSSRRNDNRRHSFGSNGFSLGRDSSINESSSNLALNEELNSYGKSIFFGINGSNRSGNTTTSCEGCADKNSTKDPTGYNRRTRNTPADRYFSKHGQLPKPKVMHAVLPLQDGTSNEHDDDDKHSTNRPQGILVIGDVHGCFDELQLLYQKALKAHQHVPFQYVILVGDLCNKGPDSAKVVRWVRLHHQQQHEGSFRSFTRWMSVRGNHDDGALAAALGDEERREKKKYQWVMDGEDKEDYDEIENDVVEGNRGAVITLSDDDVEWLSELPYTITIPGAVLGESFDTVVVHAGFIPRQSISEQTIETMITVREVEPVQDKSVKDHRDHKAILGYQYHDRNAKPKKQKDKHKKKHHSKQQQEGGENDEQPDEDSPRPWAHIWKGPPRVIFGHDARRGLQQHDWAIGLDTGAVYGKQLTGIILPEQKLVSVDAVKTHSPIADSNGA